MRLNKFHCQVRRMLLVRVGTGDLPIWDFFKVLSVLRGSRGEEALTQAAIETASAAGERTLIPVYVGPPTGFLDWLENVPWEKIWEFIVEYGPTIISIILMFV